MFALTPDDLSGKIIDCPSGQVISCDPLYELSADEIRAITAVAHDTIVANARVVQDEFVWREFASPEHLGEVRMVVMQRFLADLPSGFETGRYRAEALPDLDFRDDEFDLALCSTFLFTYSEQLSTDFHVCAIEEMCRVATEARIFPLLKSYGGTSPHLRPVVDALRDCSYTAETREVTYEFQRGGDKMLVVGKPNPEQAC